MFGWNSYVYTSIAEDQCIERTSCNQGERRLNNRLRDHLNLILFLLTNGRKLCVRRPLYTS